MKIFHCTLSLGRSDTIFVESSSKAKLLSFFNTVSEAVVRNIKEIVFSKDYNINYKPYEYIPESTYSKVIVQALSQNYSQTYVLHHIKKSVTEEELKKQFKKLVIKNEAIIDFVTIQFYDEGVSPIDPDNLYQVQYKRNSKTYTENFYGNSWQDIRDLAISLIDGEVTEIRKFVHHDSTIKKDTGSNYFKSCSFTLDNSEMYRTYKIPKVKHNIPHDVLVEHFANAFTLKGKSPKKDEIYIKYN